MPNKHRTTPWHTSLRATLLCAALSSTALTHADGVDPQTKDAHAIMKAVYDRPSGNRAIGRMTLRTKNGAGTRFHALVTRSARVEGADRNLSIVVEPAEEKNTGFLSIDHGASKESEQWVYLPKLHRTMRIPPKGRSDAFLGSDFSFADFKRHDPNAYELKLVDGAVKVDGDTCWLVEAKPRTASGLEELGYQKLQLWISQSKLLPLQVKGWLAKGPGRLKYIKVSDVRQVDGLWTPYRLEAKTLKDSELVSETTLEVTALRFGAADVSDADLTLQRLERGL